MGYGDEVMATGMARGAAARGKVIGFGDGRHIFWGPHCEEVYRHNPNIARSDKDPNIEWIHFWHRGKRPNFTQVGTRHVWNYDWKATPGEFFFDEAEKKLTAYRGGVLIEPNVPWFKSVANNKDWGFSRYQLVCDQLRAQGVEVWQISYGQKRLKGARVLMVSSYREMAASLCSVDVIVCPEGGMSHAAAAVGMPAVVLFGGYPAPQVTGYDIHTNLTGGVEPCGSFVDCPHCADAMRRISVDEVMEAVNDHCSNVAMGR